MVHEIQPAVGLDGLVSPGSKASILDAGSVWAEGIVWLSTTNTLRWSDIPANTIFEHSLDDGKTAIYKAGVEFTNGRTLDLDGTILQCSHGHRRIERDLAGTVSPVVESWNGVQFNSPNDVIVADDGSIWFSDPPYGIIFAREGHPGNREYGDHYVFRYDPRTRETRPAVTDVEEPNGLAFSPDGTVLYVADSSALTSKSGSGNRHIRAYDVKAGRCKNGRTFAVVDEGVPDGLRVDMEGNVWSSSGDGVQVYSPRGAHLGTIPVPEVVANLCFGGRDGHDLFIAATTSIYHITTLTKECPKAADSGRA